MEHAIFTIVLVAATFFFAYGMGRREGALNVLDMMDEGELTVLLERLRQMKQQSEDEQ